MKYVISFNVHVRDGEANGWTRMGFSEERVVEVEKISDLSPLLLAIERQVDEFKNQLK